MEEKNLTDKSIAFKVTEIIFFIDFNQKFEIEFVFLKEIFRCALFIWFQVFIGNFMTNIMLNEDNFKFNFFFKEYLLMFNWHEMKLRYF